MALEVRVEMAVNLEDSDEVAIARAELGTLLIKKDQAHQDGSG